MQLHVAEYQALSTRITYWILIQYTVAGAIAVAFLDLLRQPTLPALTGLRVWAAVLLIEFFMSVYYYTLFEMMSHSEYIDNILAKRIYGRLQKMKDFDMKDFEADDLWGYERYKKGNRVYSPSGMYLGMIFIIGVPCAALLFLRPPHREAIDFAGTTLSIILAFVAFFIARAAVLTQKRFAP